MVNVIGSALTSMHSFSAIRVPPLQFQHYVGTPPRLVTSDLLSGCGPVQLPAGLQSIFQMMQNGTAFIDSIANSAINQINSMIGAVTGQLNGLIGGITGQISQLTGMLGQIDPSLQSSLNGFISNLSSVASPVSGLVSTMGNSGMDVFHSQINSIVTNMPATASLISKAGQLQGSSSMGLNNIFGPIVNGGLNSTRSPVLGATQGINSSVQSTIGPGLTSISGAGQSILTAGAGVSGATIDAAQNTKLSHEGGISDAISGISSAFSSAVSAVSNAVTGMINGMMGSIMNAMQGLMNLASAAAMSVICAGEHEFSNFINSVASPALQAVLPTPQ